MEWRLWHNYFSTPGDERRGDAIKTKTHESPSTLILTGRLGNFRQFLLAAASEWRVGAFRAVFRVVHNFSNRRFHSVVFLRHARISRESLFLALPLEPAACINYVSR